MKEEYLSHLDHLDPQRQTHSKSSYFFSTHPGNPSNVTPGTQHHWTSSMSGQFRPPHSTTFHVSKNPNLAPHSALATYTHRQIPNYAACFELSFQPARCTKNLEPRCQRQDTGRRRKATVVMSLQGTHRDRSRLASSPITHHLRETQSRSRSEELADDDGHRSVLKPSP